MPYTDFHYTPTGTGVISGKEVLEQTEDAINDLGGQISGDVQTAIDTANNALNTANTASADAQNAVNTANTAYTAATNAQNTANAAQTTATNAQNAATAAQNDVNALGNRVTTAENNISQNTSDISGLTTRMGTAEGNITTLQNDVITAQGTATSAQNTATLARGQAYVVRYASVAVSDNSTVPYTDLNNIDNIKANDLLLDINGKLYQISSVDTSNETVSVTTPLTQLALDANVVHTSGDETVDGVKTFSSDVQIYNANSSNNTPSMFLRTSKVSRGSTTDGSDNISLMFNDSGNSLLSSVRCTKLSNGTTQLRNIVVTMDTSNNIITFETQLNISKNGDKSFIPSEDNNVSLGKSGNRWKNVQTNLINGLTPSILSLPNYAQRMDILGYITDLTGGNNTYTPIANGYIYLRTDSGLMLEILDATSGIGSSSIVQSNDKLRIFLPVIAQRNVYIKANCTSLVSAVFVPCCGNI